MSAQTPPPDAPQDDVELPAPSVPDPMEVSEEVRQRILTLLKVNLTSEVMAFVYGDVYEYAAFVTQEFARQPRAQWSLSRAALDTANESKAGAVRNYEITRVLNELVKGAGDTDSTSDADASGLMLKDMRLWAVHLEQRQEIEQHKNRIVTWIDVPLDQRPQIVAKEDADFVAYVAASSPVNRPMLKAAAKKAYEAYKANRDVKVIVEFIKTKARDAYLHDLEEVQLPDDQQAVAMKVTIASFCAHISSKDDDVYRLPDRLFLRQLLGWCKSQQHAPNDNINVIKAISRMVRSGSDQELREFIQKGFYAENSKDFQAQLVAEEKAALAHLNGLMTEWKRWGVFPHLIALAENAVKKVGMTS